MGVSARLDLNVLCLGCGDLRNVLFSLVDADPETTKLRLTINDYDPHVLARNILILDCIYNGFTTHEHDEVQVEGAKQEEEVELTEKNIKRGGNGTSTKQNVADLSIEDVRAIFAIWFSLGLTATQRSALNSKLRHLINESS
eukprot:GSA25T00008576001.1